jgi:hypothetical protein
MAFVLLMSATSAGSAPTTGGESKRRAAAWPTQSRWLALGPAGKRCALGNLFRLAQVQLAACSTDTIGMAKDVLALGMALLMLGVWACSEPQREAVELRHYPVAGLDGVLTQTGVELDTTVTSDGNGALRIRADGPTTVRLYETGDLDVEDARLIYRARLRTENLEGRAYLEMWCDFEGRGEFFSRALQAPLTGSVDWASQETPFFLKAGENPSNVRLNLVIEGTGTAWVDDIRLLRGTL